MATFVLIHGMFHGGWCWKKVAPLLRSAGHEVYTPTLTGLGERVHLANPEVDLDTHIQDIVNLVMYEDLHDVILVGHSFGGSLAPAIVEKIPERIAHLVNLDGPLPENGKALKDLIGDTWGFFLQNAILPGDEGRIQPIADWTFGVSGTDLAWMQSKLTPHPLKPLITPLFFTNPLAHALPRTFISCTETRPSAEEVTAEEKKYAESGWSYRFIPTGHDAMITAPEALATVLLDLSRSNS
ncbi:MAG: alpha/beta hydrolase [Anaerolineales bacterium]|nr:alpha/beta hydrolase [Anaerolineales bacterium]